MPGPPATLAQIYEEIEQWIQSPALSHLGIRLDGLVATIREAAFALDRDLESGRPTEEFIVLLQATREAYHDLESCLEEIQGGVAAFNLPIVAEELRYLRAATTNLRQCTEAIESWLEAPQLRCPKCGFGSEMADKLCPKCGLALLYPDLEPDFQSARQFLRLGPDYIAVYKVYIAVLAGEANLVDLQEPLLQLRAIVKGYPRLSGAGADAEQRAVFLELKELCQEVSTGINQMGEAFNSKETSDLNQGWLRIFEAAGRLQALLTPLLAEQGSTSASNTQQGLDSVYFSE